jgi:hypothetical protein
VALPAAGSRVAQAQLVPPKPVRTRRNLTRYRKSQIRDRQREMNRLHKIMQDTGIKLDCVATEAAVNRIRALISTALRDPCRLPQPSHRNGSHSGRSGQEPTSTHVLAPGTTLMRPLPATDDAQASRSRPRHGPVPGGLPVTLRHHCRTR